MLLGAAEITEGWICKYHVGGAYLPRNYVDFHLSAQSTPSPIYVELPLALSRVC